MAVSSSLKYVRVAGSWYEMGRFLGELQAVTIRQTVHSYQLASRFRRLLPRQISLIKDVSPAAFEYGRGMAEGARIEAERLFAWWSWEYLLHPFDHCSTALLRTKRGPVILHNEDDHPSWKNSLMFVHFVPKDGLSFSALVGRGMLPGSTVGLNAKGIGVAMDMIWRPRTPLLKGMPISLIGFQCLQARTQKELPGIYRRVKSNIGCHFLLAAPSWAESWEFFPDQKARKVLSKNYAHTNHALLPKTRTGASSSKSSRVRLERLTAAIDQGETTALSCLRQPMSEGGVLQTGARGQDLTLATAQLYLKERKMEIVNPQGIPLEIRLV
jgi:hypothetical protein